MKGAPLLRVMPALAIAACFALFAATPDAQTPSQFDHQRATRNLKALQSGAKQFQQLTPHEQVEVRVLLRAMARSNPPRNTSDCRSAWDRAASAASDLADAADGLRRCAENEEGSFSDDCGSRFRRARSAHSDYEYAVSNVQSYCR